MPDYQIMEGPFDGLHGWIGWCLWCHWTLGMWTLEALPAEPWVFRVELDEHTVSCEPDWKKPEEVLAWLDR